MTAVETAKGWTEWLDFMVKVHGYVPWDVRLVKQFEFLQDFTARLPPGGRVLDVGAGQCEMRRFFEGFRYVGADAAWGDPAWDYSHLDVIANVQRLPFPAGAFDGAINLWVAEHVRDPVAMAAEIGRVLKPRRLVPDLPPLRRTRAPDAPRLLSLHPLRGGGPAGG
jgi:SAM-dependent methyltransferase